MPCRLPPRANPPRPPPLPQLPDTYDFVFFDCSPSLESLFNINVLVAVEYVLIPIKVDKNSIEGYDVMLETIQSVREIPTPTFACWASL